MCRLLGVTTIVLTTSVPGRNDLFSKFTTFLSPQLQKNSLIKVTRNSTSASFHSPSADPPPILASDQDPSQGGHSGPVVQLSARPPTASLATISTAATMMTP